MPQHELAGFDSGKERQGVSRTVVLCPDEGSNVIA
jgi:hypothetical protein